MKIILMLYPKNTKVGQPSYERVSAFESFFCDSGVHVIKLEQPGTIKEKIKLLKYIRSEKIQNVFISMPQFSNWWLFLYRKLNVILDIRDGWSIAMKSGYGGVVKSNKLKSLFARCIESFAIKNAALVITCTQGLQQYLETLTNMKVLFISNGYSSKDKEIVDTLNDNGYKELKLVTNQYRAVCAGQFSEYGNDKAKLIIRKLSKENSSKKVILSLIGADIKANIWINDFILAEGLKNIELQLLSRMCRDKMYEQILMADVGITILRDPSYEYGTKVFDYILCGKPIFNYFVNTNPFVSFLNENASPTSDKSFLREELIKQSGDSILSVLK